MKKKVISILLTLCILLTLLPTMAGAASQGVSIQSYPTKTQYKLGEGFDTTGLRAIDYIDGIETNVNDKITFYTSKTVELKQNRPFTTTGTKVVELRYKGKKVAEYTVTVMDDTASSTPVPASDNTPADGWYRIATFIDSLRINFFSIDSKGRALLHLYGINTYFYLENKGKDQVTLKTENGKYLGISDAIKNGVQLKEVDSPYLWKFSKYNTFDNYVISLPTNTNMVVNASGGNSADGTAVIVWTHSKPANHTVFRLMKSDAPATIVTEPGLYRVASIGETALGVPFYEGPQGDLSDYIGRIPCNDIVEVTTTTKGPFAKVKYKGFNYYVNARLISKVKEPDIVCSAWAKKWLSSYETTYIGDIKNWPKAKGNWTKPITRLEMAHDINKLIRSINYTMIVQQFPVVASNAKITDTDDSKVLELARWGIIPSGKFNPKAHVTYGDFTKTLIKAMEYNEKKIFKGHLYLKAFNKGVIDKFSIGGNTSTKGKCTIEQAKVLCLKTLTWWQEMEDVNGARFEHSSRYLHKGGNSVYTGIHTIKTILGEKSNQSYLVMNEKGEGELSNKKSQKFKVTSKKFFPNIRLSTIQTMDGKYLALSGTPTNGKRLITQKKEYLWIIRYGGSHDYQTITAIHSADNVRQVLNASSWKTDNGTPVLSWYLHPGLAIKEAANSYFVFEYVGKASDSKTTPKKQ